jgi:hypothetical protein
MVLASFTPAGAPGARLAVCIAACSRQGRDDSAARKPLENQAGTESGGRTGARSMLPGPDLPAYPAVNIQLRGHFGFIRRSIICSRRDAGRPLRRGARAVFAGRAIPARERPQPQPGATRMIACNSAAFLTKCRDRNMQVRVTTIYDPRL